MRPSAFLSSSGHQGGDCLREKAEDDHNGNDPSDPPVGRLLSHGPVSRLPGAGLGAGQRAPPGGFGQACAVPSAPSGAASLSRRYCGRGWFRCAGVYRFSGGIGMPQSSHRPLTTLPPHRLHFCIQDPPSTDSGYVLAARWAAVLRCMASEETVMRISAASRYQGNSVMLNCWASSPKKGGSSVVPV